MTMAMELIRHIAGLYSGKAIKGDFTQIYITGNEIWMAQQVLAEQAEGAQGERIIQTAPERIYLIVGAECPRDVDFSELTEVSWCENDIDDGIEYVRADRTRAALAQPSPKCATCDDNGRIGGPSFYAPDEGGEPCPDCAQPSPAPELVNALRQYQHNDGSGLVFGYDKAETERIVEALRARNEWLEQVAVEAAETEQHAKGIADGMRADAERWKEQFACMQLQRDHHRDRADAAQARVAELEKQEPIQLQHMAVAEDGQLRWMTGRKIDNCELYAMPDFGRAPKLYATPVAQAGQVPQASLDELARFNGKVVNKGLLRRCEQMLQFYFEYLCDESAEEGDIAMAAEARDELRALLDEVKEVGNA